MEGPSLVIAAEEMQTFIGQEVIDLQGNTKIDKDIMCGRQLRSILTWGKHLILEFDHFFVRIHFLMYGSYRVNERKDMPPRLSLCFATGEINFYNCSVKLVDDCRPQEVYDWRVDVMSREWDADYVLRKITGCDDEKVCDVLMDQDIFAGVGNIIKNEVLFNQKLNPNSHIDALSSQQLQDLVQEAHDYSHQFYAWKKEYTLKKHWQIMRKRICPRDNIPIIKKKTGKLQRWSFYCPECQILYE